MVKRVLGSLTLVLSTALGGVVQASGSAAVGAWQMEPHTRARVLVLLAAQADLSGAELARGPEARTAYVLGQLKAVANANQLPLAAWLKAQGARVERLYIVNALIVEADAPTLADLAHQPGVALLEPDTTFPMSGPGSRGQPTGRHGLRRLGFTSDALWPGGWRSASRHVAARQRMEIGLRQIGVDKAWELGYRGQGAVIAVLDSGVQYDHPALKQKYRGGAAGHDYSWLDAVEAKAEPIDQDGHGTHVTGIAVGGTDRTAIGAAPEAEFIACRVGSADQLSPAAVLRCLQWALAPTRRDGTEPRPDLRPDIVNASWSFGSGQGCYDSGAVLRATHNLDAAGILVVATAGNRGSACKTVCAPGSYPSVLAVANYDVNTRRIHPTSSRGPVVDGGEERIKPDIAAPGVGVNSSVPPNRYERRSGTSMAAPHVAGSAALVISARPDLRGSPAALRQFLVTSGSGLRPDHCGPRGAADFNNSAGHGLLHVDVAVALALSATPVPTATATPTQTATSSPTPRVTATATATPTPALRTVFVPWSARVRAAAALSRRERGACWVELPVPPCAVAAGAGERLFRARPSDAAACPSLAGAFPRAGPVYH